MAYQRPDSFGRAYIACHVDGRTVIDLCGKKKISLSEDNNVSHDNAFALYLAVTDYLVREGYFDPDGLEPSIERYNQVNLLLNQEPED